MPRSGRHKKNNNPFLYINFLDKESIAEKTCDELKTNSLEHTCYTIVCIDDKTFITAISFYTKVFLYPRLTKKCIQLWWFSIYIVLSTINLAASSADFIFIETCPHMNNIMDSNEVSR